jgi:hypothetical protein
MPSVEVEVAVAVATPAGWVAAEAEAEEVLEVDATLARSRHHTTGAEDRLTSTTLEVTLEVDPTNITAVVEEMPVEATVATTATVPAVPGVGSTYRHTTPRPTAAEVRRHTEGRTTWTVGRT